LINNQNSNCEACGGTDASRLFACVERPFTLLDCDRCGLVRTDPLLTGPALLAYYPAVYYGDQNRRFHPLLEKLVAWFADSRARAIARSAVPGSIVEVGCGRGHVLAYLRRRGWRTSGVELSTLAARHAQQVYGLDIFVGDFCDASYAPASVDVVFIWHVFEHLHEPARVLEKARAILKPGGRLTIAVPNFASLQSRFAGRHWFHLDVPRHLHHFRKDVLVQMLESRGFSVTRVSHMNLEQNIYGWLQSFYNRAGFHHNLLYELLRNKSARSEILSRHRAQVLAILLLLPFLGVLSVISALLEAGLGVGGTIDVYAQKREA
jgi:SAM-dependent methyltransferase